MLRQSGGLAENTPLAAVSDLFSVIARGQITRADLARETGISRMTLGQRLGLLVDSGLVIELAQTVPSGGRPTRMLGINPDFGVLLSADVGESFIRLAVTDAQGTIRQQAQYGYDRMDGPEAALELIVHGLKTLLQDLQPAPFPIGLGVSLPAPIDVKAGKVVGPSILYNWDDLDVVEWLSTRLDVPVVVENDVNLMTLFEAVRSPGTSDHFMFIKVGTGIGSGLILDGHLYRGADGASGDIGHIQLNRDNAPLCRCGKVGCLEAHAAGWAIARDLRAVGLEARDAHDVVRLVNQHVPEAIGLVRQAGRAVGEVVADAVSILNPSTIRIGGTLGKTHEYLLAGVRERVYQRCLPLATSRLVIELAPPSDMACLVGATISLRQKVFAGPFTGAMLERFQAWQTGQA